jgi:thiol-disulfide isomerase/thioredoxin
MITKIFIISSFLIYSTIYSQIKTGSWEGKLLLNDETTLPIKLMVKKDKKKTLLEIKNGEESILLTQSTEKKDSFEFEFPNFHSVLRFSVSNKKEIHGFWYNFNKTDYKIPFSASFIKKEYKNEKPAEFDVNGKWKTIFSPNNPDSSYAIGVFKQNKNIVTGTFLTETGDYRFLEGKINGSHMYLSCFDGSHAFLFVANYENDKLNGTFYSGNHYQTNWTANYDPTFELRDPNLLTYIVKEEPFSFTLKDLEGKDFSFPNEEYKDKVIIIQIMGTWCPNCIDETKLLKDLYAKYNRLGLEIISIAYESAKTFEGQVEKINLLKKRHQLNFKFLVGGQANKSLSSQQFPMLNEIISYPTTLFIGRDGEVKKIHTGFNGPGTGQIYLDFVEEIESFLKQLLD